MHCVLRRSVRTVLYNSYTRSSVILKSNCVADNYNLPILYSKCSLLGIYPLLSRSYHSGQGKLIFTLSSVPVFNQARTWKRTEHRSMSLALRRTCVVIGQHLSSNSGLLSPIIGRDLIEISSVNLNRTTS